MTTHIGKEGQVLVGANVVAEVTGFSLTTNAAIVDDTELSDDWESNKAGNMNFNGSVDCHWDETDTLGQGAMVEGAQVTLNLYPMGTATGAKYFSGLATIESINYGTGINQTVTAAFSFKGSGALTRPTAA